MSVVRLSLNLKGLCPNLEAPIYLFHTVLYPFTRGNQG